MLATINQTNVSLISLEAVLHSAALASQAIIDGIPEDTSVYDEADVIEAATAPVDALARLILRMSYKADAEKTARSRAQAWMAGNYWATAGAAA